MRGHSARYTGKMPESDEQGEDGQPQERGGRASWAGTQPSPEFPSGLSWVNVDHPLTLGDLRGKMVLLDFWTQGCINCQHIVPDLKRLEAEFGDALAVIGVHSGKYATEHEDRSIEQAARRYGIEHPVVNDEEFVFWRTFGASAWPTLVLIDPAGNLVGFHAGEGVYPLFQPILASLAEEFDQRGMLDRQPVALGTGERQPGTVLAYPSLALPDVEGRRVFIADAGHNRIIVTDLEGRIDSSIGSGREGLVDGPAGEAAFRQPQGLALSGDGRRLFVADTRNHALRAVDLASGEVSTIAGTGRQLDRLPVGRAPATEVALASPWGLLLHQNSLYVSMAGVHQIWVMDLAEGTIGVFAGTSREGIEDGNRRRMATLAQPSGLASDGRYLYWVDPESSAVRRVLLDSADGEVETLVGTGLFDYGDEDGTGKAARLQHPQGITCDGGMVYIADTYNHRIRTLDPVSLEVRTLAGSGQRGRADGEGIAASFDEPGGISAAGGTLYVADTNNHLIRLVDAESGETRSLLLSNLEAIRSDAGFPTILDQLPPVEAAPGSATLRVVLDMPEGHHLNRLGASTLRFESTDPSVVSLPRAELFLSADGEAGDAAVPVELAEGSAVVNVTGTIYFCREGEEALCFVEQVAAELPVTVRTGAGTDEIVVHYRLARDRES